MTFAAVGARLRTDRGALANATPAASYTASAVHFGAATVSLSIASLSCTDGASASFSFWLKIAAEQAPSASVWAVDVAADYEIFGGWNFLTPTEIRIAFGDDSNTTSIDSPAITVAAWHHFLGSFNCTTGVVKLYLDDTDQTGTIGFSGASSPLMNGLSFYLGDDSYSEGSVMDMADFWFAPNVSLLTAGDIPQATRRLFIDASGKPVNPSGFPASAILFSGNSAAFVTNQGTGGAFTMSGSLTNASTSPSD